MTLVTISGYISIGLLLLFLVLGVPVGVSLGAAGFIGFIIYSRGDFVAAASGLATGPYFIVSSYIFVVIPLFILMGLFAVQTGLAKDIYDVAWKTFGRIRGGLAVATIWGSAAFGAVSGSSVVNTAVFTKLGLGQMTRYGYHKLLSCGSIASSGILGMLIPPSGLVVIYGILTEHSIGKLLLGGVGAGLLYAAVLSINVLIVCALKPEYAPRATIRVPFKEVLISLKSLWVLPILIMIITGGIYLGIFTPTEAAAIGTVATFILFLVRRGFDRNGLMSCLLETGKTSCMIFLIFVGARIFSQLLMVSGITTAFMNAILESNMSPLVIVILFLIMYLVLGCFLDAASMLVITIPVIYPILLKMGFDLTWLGLVIIVAIEIGLVTPPVGLNVFALQGAAADEEYVPLATIFRGSALFLPIMVAGLVILFLVPDIITWLPNHMMR